MGSYLDYPPTHRFQRTFALSPNGEQLAYVDDRTGPFNLVVQHMASEGDAKHITNLTDEAVRRVVWHRAGDWMVYEADNQGNEHNQL